MKRKLYTAIECRDNGTSRLVGGISTTDPKMAEHFKARFAGREDIIIHVCEE